jgi:SPP1 family predicted phage head-tail adaptor
VLSSKLLAGKLRHQITLQILSGAQDSTGGFSSSYQNVATVWASIEAVIAKDNLAANEFVSQVTHKITIRYMDGVTSAMRVVFKERDFQVQGVLNPDERTKLLILLAVEIQGGVQ